jgi:hypothetical protein
MLHIIFKFFKLHHNIYINNIQGDQKVSVHLMITTQKITSDIQSVPRQSPDLAADRPG